MWRVTITWPSASLSKIHQGERGLYKQIESCFHQEAEAREYMAAMRSLDPYKLYQIEELPNVDFNIFKHMVLD